MIEIVSATKLSQEEFWGVAPLAVHLKRSARDERVRSNIAYSNSRGLPEVYNERIDTRDPADTLVFIHDDVWIEDVFFVDRILEALKIFDVVGLAGTRRRQPFQRLWDMSPITKDLDRGFTSGVVGQGDAPFGEISSFGPTPAECKLLDGLMIAARTSRLLDKDVRFDPRFMFHYYDLDFCRTATSAGLRIGTWPISVTHRSPGLFGSPEWLGASEVYFEKWGD